MQRERELEEDERDFLALAALLEQREKRAVVLDRLVEGVLEARLVARAQEVIRGLGLVLGGEPVMREQTERLDVAVAVPLLEPLRRAAVEAGPLLAEQCPVRSLLDEGVAEAVLRLRPAAALSQQTEALELVERVRRDVSDDALEQR